jgi:hypothetical protein
MVWFKHGSELFWSLLVSPTVEELASLVGAIDGVSVGDADVEPAVGDAVGDAENRVATASCTNVDKIF